MSDVVACGYIGITTDDLAAWRSFATDGLGLQEAAGSTDARLLLRMDERAWRVAVEPGAPGVGFVGWEVRDAAALVRVSARLEGAGVAVKDDAALALERGVDGLATCTDPGGHTLEFFYSARIPEDPFISPQGAAFVTADVTPGDMGLGHVVVAYPDVDEARRFYVDVLDFRLSDTCLLGEPWYFLHVNPRHHSLAFGPGTGTSSFHHFMLETTDIDMVGRALDRLTAMHAPVTTTLGRHTNDHMVSFYVRTPSGFEVEYGYAGRKVDDATWTLSTYESASRWGHRPCT